jgi:hypothetical protein
MMKLVRLLVLLVLLAPAARAESPRAPLEAADVERWLETSIDITRMQMRLQADGTPDGDVLAVFFDEKERLILAHGYDSADAYEDVNQRVMAAYSALEQEARRAERAPEPRAQAGGGDMQTELERQMAEIRASDMLSEQAKQQMLAQLQEQADRIAQHDPRAIERDLEAAAEEMRAPTRPDWPAVEAHMADIEHFSEWAAGNRAAPPVTGGR